MILMDKLKRYENLQFLGEGQFATVYKARDLLNGKIVAVKKCLDSKVTESCDELGSECTITEPNRPIWKVSIAIRLVSMLFCSEPFFDIAFAAVLIKVGHSQEVLDGINRTALREIKLLPELSHVNIISLLDVFGYTSNISLVFDFMDTDLEVVIKDTGIIFTPSNIKAYSLMTFLGLEYLHDNWILHRDLKPNNLLVSRSGILKIGDFGLAKSYGSPNRVNTHQVVTRWYRCPELLFGARAYGTAVDVWSMGCIMAELLLRVPFLPGESDLDQLTRIFQTLGSPTEETWPGVTLLPDYIQFKPFTAIPFKSIFTAASDDLIDLMNTLLCLNPNGRITCSEALQHPYFSNHPPPTKGEHLPMPASIVESNLKPPNGHQSRKRKLNEPLEGGTRAKKLVF